MLEDIIKARKFMDTVRKVMLLNNFYSSIDKTKMKLEVKDWGFEFIDTLQKDGTIVEYAELKGLIPKYRLINVPFSSWNFYLHHHVEKSGNVCGYFDKEKNNVFAFNIDTMEKTEDNTPTDIVKEAIRILVFFLKEYGIEPLVVVSGRGYHVWVRIDKPVDNKKICEFMMLILVRTRVLLKLDDPEVIKKLNFSCYPSDNESQRNSLRLFGNWHIKNKHFSHICTENNGVLSEEASWRYFEEYIKTKSVSEEKFNEALKNITEYFEGIKTEV